MKSKGVQVYYSDIRIYIYIYIYIYTLTLLNNVKLCCIYLYY